MGRGKNAPKNRYIHKALSLIDVELELLNLKIAHPEQFNSPVSTEFKSDLYVIPKSKDLGIIGIAEIVLGLFLQGEITGKNGKHGKTGMRKFSVFLTGWSRKLRKIKTRSGSCTMEVKLKRTENAERYQRWHPWKRAVFWTGSRNV